MAVRWSKKETKKLLDAINGATSVGDALARVKAALPHRIFSKPTLSTHVSRMGLSLSDIISANRLKVSDSKDGEELASFVAVAKKGGTLEEICNRVDASPKRVRQLIEKAKAAGYAIDITGHHVGYVPPKPLVGEKRIVAQPGEEHKFAVASDIHVGSKYFLREYFIDFVERAYAEGVRTIFGPGDILDGCYKHSRWEEEQHGFWAQAKEAARVFPRKPGLRYIMIAGNHDETFEPESGLSVVHQLPSVFRDAGRDDFEMVGARGAYVRFAPKGGRGVLIEMWHPRGSVGYATSYKLQRHVEDYGVGQKPDFLLTGHWHQTCYIVRRGVHAFACGTWHGGLSSFGKSIGGAPAIGGWIISFNQTPQGTLRDVRPQWVSYYEKEEIRSMDLG